MELSRALPAIIAVVVVGTSAATATAAGGAWSALGAGDRLRPAALGHHHATGSPPDQVAVQRGLLSPEGAHACRGTGSARVDITSHFLHRLLGLARVAVGTGQSDRGQDSGLVLDGLSTVMPTPATTAARRRPPALPRGARPPDRARRRVGAGRTPWAARAPPPAPARRCWPACSPRWIGYAPFTLSGLVTIGVPSPRSPGAPSTRPSINPERSASLRDADRPARRLPLWRRRGSRSPLGRCSPLVAVLSTVGYVLAFWNFRLTRSGRHAARLARPDHHPATTIEERRLRGVELSEPLLLRAVGGARAIAIATGLRVGPRRRAAAAPDPAAARRRGRRRARRGRRRARQRRAAATSR